MRVVDEFLSVHMHESLHVVIERDEVIPSVVYRVKVPMTEQHWLDYNTILAQFKQACDLHNALCAGKEDFDSVTKVHRAEGLGGQDGQLTWPQLTVPDLTLEQMAAGLVKQNRLGLPWDYGRMHYHPELVPEELGGQLEGYKWQ
jgi:hypothetical protein